jgi:hypothetical protein
MPKDEPVAPNPPSGAAIDYALAKHPPKLVTLEIHDAAGQLVQRYSSADTVAKPDPAKLRTAPQWFVSPPHLEATPGMHRFVWPLRYAAPKAGANAPRTDGVWAPPGAYRVTLTVDGKAIDRTLTVAPDPRVKLDPPAYREQFQLARRVEATTARVTAARAAADTVRKAVVDLRKSANGGLADTLDAFQARLTALSGEAPTTNPANASVFPPKHIESLRWLSGALADLMRMVDGADARPSPDALEAFARLQPIVDTTLADWRRFASVDLEALNRRLRATGRKPISLSP